LPRRWPDDYDNGYAQGLGKLNAHTSAMKHTHTHTHTHGNTHSQDEQEEQDTQPGKWLVFGS